MSCVRDRMVFNIWSWFWATSKNSVLGCGSSIIFSRALPSLSRYSGSQRIKTLYTDSKGLKLSFLMIWWHSAILILACLFSASRYPRQLSKAQVRVIAVKASRHCSINVRAVSFFIFSKVGYEKCRSGCISF
jgi:hypothetical protein